MADRKSAGFCYDIATLLPLYNPMAVPIPDYVDPNTTSISASPLSTVLVFGQPFGESPNCCAAACFYKLPCQLSFAWPGASASSPPPLHLMQ